MYFSSEKELSDFMIDLKVDEELKDYDEPDTEYTDGVTVQDTSGLERTLERGKS